MNFNILKRIFKESNIHGFSYIFKANYHITERTLWMLFIITSFYFASKICYDEWQRFRANPIVLFLETNYRDWEYTVPGMTICTHYIDYERVDNFISTSLRISRNDSKFEVYKKFVEAVTLATYKNLGQFRQFEESSSLDKLDAFDMLNIAKGMREYLLPTAGFNAVITEMGICFSSTYLYRFQNVSNRIVSTNFTADDLCSVLSQELCNNIGADTLLEFDDNVDYKQILFIHNKDDVMDPEAASTKFYFRIIVSAEFIINEIISSGRVNQLLPHQRKCLLKSESPLKYFGTYTTNLCKMSCRMDAALRFCGCIPFFYKIKSADHPVCNIKGMICLSNTKWHEQKCDCFPLCDSYKFRPTISIKGLKSEGIGRILSSIKVTIIYPKTRIKRDILYSADNLLVSIGGAFGLFVGCSFISIVELCYLFIESLIDIFIW